MKFLLDECCDASLVDALRNDGHDIFYVAETMPGTIDEDVLHRAFVEDRILITEDKDFGELAVRLHLPARGVILLRFEIGEENLKLARIREVIRSAGNRFAGAFVVIEASKTRFRPLRSF